MQESAASISANPVVSDRVAGFDMLRGLCALAVAMYHVLGWAHIAHLHTWGTYGVYIFFVLSGASIWIAYAERLRSGFPLARFLMLRLVRLVPLYLLALAWVLTMQLRAGSPQLGAAFLNGLFQFGLGNPGATSQVVGGWSLGIEFVFYLLFPICLALLAGRLWWIVLLLAFASQHVFVAGVFANGKNLAENWVLYTQFLSFVFYFIAGCVIGRFVHAGHLRSHWLGLPLAIGCLAVIGSLSGDTAEAGLLGLRGLALSLLSVGAVAAASAVRVGQIGLWLSDKLGTASYGVYILHPLFVYPLGKILSGSSLVAATISSSFIFALILHRFYEAPVQDFAKKLRRART